MPGSSQRFDGLTLNVVSCGGLDVGNACELRCGWRPPAGVMQRRYAVLRDLTLVTCGIVAVLALEEAPCITARGCCGLLPI